MGAAALLLFFEQASVADVAVAGSPSDRLRRVSRADEYLRRVTDNEESAQTETEPDATGFPHYLLLFFHGASVQEPVTARQGRLRRVNYEETYLRRVTDTEGATPQNIVAFLKTFASKTFAAKTFRVWHGGGD